MNDTERSDALHARVQAEIAASAAEGFAPWSRARFDALARELFAHQVAGCAPYAGFCRVRGVPVELPGGFRTIPAVPTDVFKTIELCTFDPAAAAAVFMTSGTTVGTRGRHFLRRTDTYEASLGPWLRRWLLPGGGAARVLVAAPSAAQDPHSSLTYMLQWAVERVGDARSGFFWDSETGPRVRALGRALLEAAADGVPVLLLGTARALQFVAEELLAPALAADEPLVQLPKGSCIMETGGFKGAIASMPRERFYGVLAGGLGLPLSAVVSEYGMTELASQGYHPGHRARVDAGVAAGLREASGPWPKGSRDEAGLPRVLVFPPWCRVGAVDPDTLELVPDGRRGLLRFWDLANVDSILAIQTADEGIVLPQGVLLLGRDPSATPRGCSLAVDEILRGAAS